MAPENGGRQPGEEGSGIEFVYSAGLQKIREQMSLIDSLDVKMGVLIGFLGALVVAALAALLTASPSRLAYLGNWRSGMPLAIAASLGAVAGSLFFAYQAFRMRHYYSGPRFQDLYEWANEEPENTKKEFLPTLLEAVNLNEQQLEVKQRNAQRAVLWVFLALLALVATEFIIISEVLRRKA